MGRFKSYTWQSTPVTKEGKEDSLEYIKRPCFKKKKKERKKRKKKEKQLVLRLSKYTSHFLCKGLSPERGCHSALPVYPNISLMA